MTRRRSTWSPSASFDRSLADNDEQRRIDAQRERERQELERMGGDDE